MTDKMSEPITVAAVFSNKPLIKPVWFVWQNRQYRIEKITYTWTDREGRASRYHFAVTDGGNLYELCYHSEKLTWQLEAVSAED